MSESGCRRRFGTRHGNRLVRLYTARFGSEDAGRKKGRLAGTIGGGAVEYRSEQIAAEILENKRSGEHNFTLTKTMLKI